MVGWGRMQRVVLPGALASSLFGGRAHADGAPTATGVDATPRPADTSAAVLAELERQREAIARLEAAADDARQKAEHPALRVSGFVQVDWVIHNQASQDEINDSTGQPLNEDRFTLRRGRVRLDAERGLLVGALEIDANTTSGPQVRPIDAEVSLRWPARPDDRLPSLTATVGLLRIPFGFEVQELDTVRPFLERATGLDALFPGQFDLGARLKVKYRAIDLAVAVMNGDPIGSKVFPDLDPVGAKDVVGRVGVDVEIASGVRLIVGVSADAGTGFHPGTPATKPQLAWQDRNGDGLVQPNEIIAVGGSPATPSQTFQRFAIGGDARLVIRLPRLGELSFRGEVVDAQNLDRGLEVADPVGAGHDLRELAWSGGATQELTRWAMIGARYDVYSPDLDATQQRAVNLVPVDRSYSTLACTALLRYEQARLLLEYDVNRNPLGIGANGAPTTLADNALTLRGQLVF